MPRPPVVALRVLDFIKDWKEEHDGNSPTYEQIADNFDCTTMTAWDHVQRLERMNMIVLDEDRKITLIDGEYIAPR